MKIRQASLAIGLSAAMFLPAGAPGAAEVTAESYKAAVAPCMRAGDLKCAEGNWVYYLRLRPNDGNAVANLGIVMNRRDNHQGAIAQFERAMDLGEGTYDLFSYYADSLAKVGRIDDAIDWSYKALAVVPKLVDVRGSLAKLLVQQKRHYEALALLAAFDDELQASGHAAYFEGQRIAIESSLARQAAALSATEQKAIRLPRHAGHFFATVSVGDARPAVFLVDTGASKLVVSDQFLASTKVNYKVIDNKVPMQTADGRRVFGRVIRIASIHVGPYELKDATAISCAGCLPLLGQSALSKFDLKTTKVQGVEFLTLSPRT